MERHVHFASWRKKQNAIIQNHSQKHFIYHPKNGTTLTFIKHRMFSFATTKRSRQQHGKTGQTDKNAKLFI